MNKELPEKIVAWLFHDCELSLTFSEWSQLLFSILIKTDVDLSDCFFNALMKRHVDAVDNEFILYNVLAYLPFSNPKHHQELIINGMSYRIDKIPITSPWLSAPYYIYGLRSEHHEAPSYLLFQGTTTPSDNGFLAGLLADTYPIGAIGSQLYQRGKTVIQGWIEAAYQRTHQEVICVGQSLGGAMCLHSFIHQPDKVDFIALNPPTLTSREEHIYQKHRIEQLDTHRVHKVITHINDPVYALGDGYLPEGTLVLKYGDAKDNLFFSHARGIHPYEFNQHLEFELFDEAVSNNWLWKLIKPILHVLVISIACILLPIRMLLQMVACFNSEPEVHQHMLSPRN